MKANQWVVQQNEEKNIDTKIRQLMLKSSITYHEAKDLVLKGQKGLMDF
ncbi:hypothetical protein JW968_02980 [Candidatus Woesearchaeota archaeon]|nr:hypothetical protein [Candidatus Woesearchaeota archaeon]